MAVTKKQTQNEINDRLKSKGLEKLAKFFSPKKSTIAPAPAFGKPVESTSGVGSVAPIGNIQSVQQQKANIAAKHGDDQNFKTASQKRDEDVDTFITALSMFMPASVIERGGAKLIGKLLGKLGGKVFKPQIAEEATERILSNNASDYLDKLRSDTMGTSRQKGYDSAFTESQGVVGKVEKPKKEVNLLDDTPDWSEYNPVDNRHEGEPFIGDGEIYEVEDEIPDLIDLDGNNRGKPDWYIKKSIERKNKIKKNLDKIWKNNFNVDGKWGAGLPG